MAIPDWYAGTASPYRLAGAVGRTLAVNNDFEAFRTPKDFDKALADWSDSL